MRDVERPEFKKPEDIIKWFCAAFGLVANPGENGVEEQILQTFVMAAQEDKGLSSSEIELDPPMARSTVIYHLNRFMDSGLIVKRGRLYFLRAPDMARAIEEIEYDMEREFQRLIDAAKEFQRLMEELQKQNRER